MQIDFTEGRLALKLDPSGGLLRTFIELNNQVLGAFSDTERRTDWRAHVSGRGPGLDTQRGRGLHGATAGVVRVESGTLLRSAGQREGSEARAESDRRTVEAGQIVFVGVTDVINPKIESPEVVRDRVMEAAEFIPLESLGTTDDCGFSPFADDTSTSRETAFAKVRARVEGTAMAEKELGV